MSSILDALRKSDDKRQQGSNNGVDQIKFSESQPSKKSRKGFYVLVLFLLLIAAGLWAYQAGYLAPIKEMFASTEQTKIANDKANAPKVKQQTPETEVKTKEVVALKPPKPKNIKEKIEEKKQTEKAKESGVQHEDEKNADILLPVVKKEPAKSGRLLVDGKPAAEIVDEGKDKAKQENNKANSDATVTQNRTNKKSGNEQEYLMVHQLPFETRQQLPVLKINVHVFDPQPENRMVVINGVSFQVGDSIEEMALVKDITSEGVVIEVAGTVFMIPK